MRRGERGRGNCGLLEEEVVVEMKEATTDARCVRREYLTD
jgi:hypothetical protein